MIIHLIICGLYPWLTAYHFSQPWHQLLVTTPLFSASLISTFLYSSYKDIMQHLSFYFWFVLLVLKFSPSICAVANGRINFILMLNNIPFLFIWFRIFPISKFKVLVEKTASKHVYYLGWNRSPTQVGCMRQVFGPGALGRPRGIGWRERWEGGSGWGTHVNPWLIHFNVWQKPLQYCKVISLQLIKIN